MKSTVLTTTAVLFTLLLTGCGGEASNGESGGEAPDQYENSLGGDTGPSGSSVNPVDVLRKVPDCTIGAGVETGERDMDGNLYASCDIEGVKFVDNGDAYTTEVGVTVRAVDPADVDELGYEDAIPDDSHKIIFGDGFYLTLTSSPAVFGTDAVDVDAIAAAVDGQVV